jgi:hypothetical protein
MLIIFINDYTFLLPYFTFDDFIYYDKLWTTTSRNNQSDLRFSTNTR